MALAVDVGALEARALDKDGLTVLKAIARLEDIMMEVSQSAIKKRCDEGVDTYQALIRLENAGFAGIRLGGPSVGYLRAYTTPKGRNMLTQLGDGPHDVGERSTAPFHFGNLPV